MPAPTGARRRSPVGAGSTRDGASLITAMSGFSIAHAGPIAGRARSHRGAGVRQASRARRRSPVGAGSTRDGGGLITAISGFSIAHAGPSRAEPAPTGRAGVRQASRARRRSPVGAGSTRDGGGVVAADSMAETLGVGLWAYSQGFLKASSQTFRMAKATKPRHTLQ